MTVLKDNKEQHTPNMDKKDEEFLERLKTLSETARGDLAVLKRNAGNTIAESHGAMKAFYNILPFGIADSPNEEIYFLIATLYGHNNKNRFTGDFGQSMRHVKESSGSESIDQRMATLLDCDFGIVDGYKPGGGEFAYRIRQCVKLANSHEVGVDWLRLLQDLKFWNYQERRVQKRWARSYFGYGKPANEQVQTSNQEVKV
jgi:CRISPR system Cascade subunit CasB